MAERYKLCVDAKGRKESGIYENSSGQKYLRIREGNRNTYVSLKTKSLAQAIKFRDARRSAKVAAKLGVALAPEDSARYNQTTITMVMQRYQRDDYPDKKGVPRKEGKHRLAEERYCQTLLGYFKGMKAAYQLAQDDLDLYRKHRTEQVAAGPKKGEGNRTVDLELNCLNNAMRWAVRKKLLPYNPIASRIRYYAVRNATHCREFAVSNADELHQAAGALMSSRRSEVLGWQMLAEGMTGLRTEEILQLRMDAKAGEPGHIFGDTMCVRRAEKSDRENSFVKIHEGLRQVLGAHKIWHAARYPLSPWFFPGRDKSAARPVNKSILTKALDRLFRAKRLSKKFTSHGCRAFYVLVRRSQGASDTEITFEINHTGGVATLEQVYGIAPPHWKDGKSSALDWMPKGVPAWSKVRKVDFSPVQPADNGSFEI